MMLELLLPMGIHIVEICVAHAVIHTIVSVFKRFVCQD